nr:DUF2232 domain-containing protein [uncultured Desulfobulbus sp.]
MGFLGLSRGNASIPPVLLFALSILFFLPVAAPSVFGWVNGFLAVPVFFLLQVYGTQKGSTVIRSSLVLAGLAALILQRIDIYLFALTMLPLGYVLHASASRGDSAAQSGGKGLMTLLLSWLVFWTGLGIVTSTNPYASLIQTLDLGFQQALEMYTAKDAGLAPEMVYNLQLITNNLRETVPRVMPGLLATAAILTVWMNMAAGNRFVARAQSAPWGPYEGWKLPDQLVWLPIVAIITVLIGDGTIRNIGLWFVFVSGALYLFQGLAVLLALLNRWHVPPFARIFLYGFLIIQSYSLIILALLGMCDVWFNLRHKSIER